MGTVFIILHWNKGKLTQQWLSQIRKEVECHSLYFEPFKIMVAYQTMVLVFVLNNVVHKSGLQPIMINVRKVRIDYTSLVSFCA